MVVGWKTEDKDSAKATEGGTELEEAVSLWTKKKSELQMKLQEKLKKRRKVTTELELCSQRPLKVWKRRSDKEEGASSEPAGPAQIPIDDGPTSLPMAVTAAALLPG